MHINNKAFAGKNVLITGAARRLGQEIALAFAKQGANIIIHYFTSELRAVHLVDEIQETGSEASLFSLDLSIPNAAEILLEQVITQVGKIDILINNASIFQADSIEGVNFSSLSDNIYLNSWVPFALGRALFLKGGTGQIINLLDTRIDNCDSTHVAYTISKHLLAHFTTLMALDFAPSFTVNAVAPGAILASAGGTLIGMEDKIPMHKTGATEDITQAVLFLAGANFITGQVIYVDGGQHLTGKKY